MNSTTRQQSTYPETLSGDMALELPEFADPPADPIRLLRRWLAAAEAADVREPRVATFATSDRNGRVSARTVLVKDLTDDGLALGISAQSRKGRDITDNPHAALNFYWRERAQQISLSGTISQADSATSDRFFAARPRSAQALATRSEQSMPSSVTELDRLHSTVERLAGQPEPISRPPGWSIWTLCPDEIEFWHGDPNRFHRRLRYVRHGDQYQHHRLQP